MLHHPRKLLDKIHGKLKAVTETLKVQAEQLIVHEKYKDAEYIYTRILIPSESIRWEYLTRTFYPSECTRWQDLISELAPKMVLLQEKLGNLSVAEMIQEFFLRAVSERAIAGDDDHRFDLETTEKLCQLYIHFYHRVNRILLDFGEDESFSAEFARMAVFYRIATLKIDALSHAITARWRELVPKRAFHIAAELDAVSLIAILVERDDVHINLEDELKDAALHIAVQKGPFQLIQMFLSAHANMEIADGDDKTALLLAVGVRSKNGLEIVRFLLDAGVNGNFRSHHDLTPLHLAARLGMPETVEILLDYDVDVNAMSFGKTPLFEAIENVPSRGVPIARQLLHAGADLEVSYEDPVGCLMRAAQLGNAAMLNVFLSCEVHQGFNANQGLADRTTALHGALEGPLSTQRTCISMLLKAGVTIETKRKGRTALGTALRRGRLAAARQLLEQGANIETEIEGERLLCYSVRRGDESATRLLLEKGADARQENHKGESPLIIAVAGSRDAIVKMLLESGGLIIYSLNDTYSCQIGDPVLHCAIRNASPAIIEMLLEANRGYLLTKDRKGNAALHKAILQNHERHDGILDLLLKYCDGSWYFVEKNSDCNTPLHLAVSLKQFKAAKMLLAAQSKEDACYTLNIVKNAACQDVGSLLSRMSIPAGDPCFEAFEELKRSCQILMS